MDQIYDVIIIGSGPAGMSAAIYASRAKMSHIVFERSFSGGQIINTYEVDNYPGIKNISGFDLANLFREHTESFGSNIISEEIVGVDVSGAIKKINTVTDTYLAKTIILATGASWRKLGVEGEDQFSGLGVSYCATCDGAFYSDKVTAVIGGGDVAVEDAIYLARMCKKVYLVHRRDELRAVKILQNKLLNTDNIEVIWDTVLDKIEGDETVTRIKITNKKTKEQSELEVDGVFIAVGSDPNSALLVDHVEHENNWIITDENCETNVDGVFAAGDVRKKSLRQIITSAADGAIAIYALEKYL